VSHGYAGLVLRICNRVMTYANYHPLTRTSAITDSVHYSLHCSKSFKVTDFDTNQKPVCDVILVNKTNLHPISHRFPVIVQYSSNYRLWRRSASC